MEIGQEATDKILKKAAQNLIAHTEEDTDLGHLTYGVFGLAVPGRKNSETELIHRNLIECLEGLDISPASKQPHLIIKTFSQPYPARARRAEDLINQGLLSFQSPAPRPLQTED